MQYLRAAASPQTRVRAGSVPPSGVSRIRGDRRAQRGEGGSRPSIARHHASDPQSGAGVPGSRIGDASVGEFLERVVVVIGHVD